MNEKKLGRFDKLLKAMVQGEPPKGRKPDEPRQKPKGGDGSTDR
jgi:hypothetical protein